MLREAKLANRVTQVSEATRTPCDAGPKVRAVTNMISVLTDRL